MDEKIFGVRLRLLREKVKLSQLKLAYELGGVSQPLIARYEKGDMFPSYPVLIRIVDYFNVSTDYLLGRTDSPAGKIYEQEQTNEIRIDDFIEMCFDPTSSVSVKLKEALRKCWRKSINKKERMK